MLTAWMLDLPLFLFFPQGANLAHRAGQLLQKQYLIIHPTADGKDLRQSVAPY